MCFIDLCFGDVVIYWMEFVNNGSVDFIKSEIVFGFGGVFDDFSWDMVSFGVIVGGVMVFGDIVIWRGLLVFGERVVIVFIGIWYGDGDGFVFFWVEFYGYIC